MAFPIVPAEQLVGVSELDPELADLPDAVDNDENTVNILRKNQLVTLMDFSNVEQNLPQARSMLGELFGIMDDSDVRLKLQLSRAVWVWQVSKIASLRAGRSNDRILRKYRRDQQEIRQTQVPHFQHGHKQGAGRHAQNRGQGRAAWRWVNCT